MQTSNQMVYNKKMSNVIFSAYDIFVFIFTSLSLCLFIFGMIAIGWCARGYFDAHQQKYEKPSKILQPQFAANPAPVLPKTDPLPQPVKKAVVMKFPKPSEIRKRNDSEALAGYLDSLVSQPRQSGSLSVETVLEKS